MVNARFSLYRRTMTDDSRFALIAGATLAATGIVFGASGAHGLRDSLSPEALGWWQTGVQYQMWQAIGLVAIGAAPIPRRRGPALMLVIGTLIFSASLYATALSGARWLGVVTPVGGALMSLGWLWLVLRLTKTAS
jgi:uncharacterized membrane protein YgdD (TMEM256/DUF423 family)